MSYFDNIISEMIDPLSFFNPIPHGMCRAHNFTGGGHIDPTTLEALGEPKYVP